MERGLLLRRRSLVLKGLSRHRRDNERYYRRGLIALSGTSSLLWSCHGGEELTTSCQPNQTVLVPPNPLSDLGR